MMQSPISLLLHLVRHTRPSTRTSLPNGPFPFLRTVATSSSALCDRWRTDAGGRSTKSEHLPPSATSCFPSSSPPRFGFLTPTTPPTSSAPLLRRLMRRRRAFLVGLSNQRGHIRGAADAR